MGAAARYAHREAVACFEQALTALRHLLPSRDLVERSVDLRFQLRQSCVPLLDHRRILEHLQEAEAAARALGDDLRLAWALVYRTHGLLLAGDCHEALEAGQAALAIAHEADDKGLQESANFYLAQVHHWVGSYHRGADLLRRNVTSLESELAERQLPTKQVVNSRTFLAWCLAELGEFEEAIGRAGEAIQAAEKRATAYDLVHAYSGAGLVHLRRGDFDDAIAASTRAVELCRGRDFSALWAIAASILGPAYTLAGRASEAIPLLEEAAEIAAPLAAPGLGFLAEAYLAAGRPDDAQAVGHRALGLAVQRGEQGWQAWTLRLLGEVAAHRDRDVVGAEDAYRRAMTLAETLGMRPLAGHCHLGLGRLYHHLGRRPQAEDHLGAALALYRGMAMRFWAATTEAEMR